MLYRWDSEIERQVEASFRRAIRISRAALTTFPYGIGMLPRTLNRRGLGGTSILSGSIICSFIGLL
jgi:hypothetical protein